MRIAEFCRRSGLSRDTVRYYERRALLRPRVDANRYRDYSDADLERVRLIRIGQLLGFGLAEIKRLGRAWEKNALGPREQVAVLRARHSDVLQRIAELDAIRSYLEQKMAWLQGGGRGPQPDLDVPPLRRRHRSPSR